MAWVVLKMFSMSLSLLFEHQSPCCGFEMNGMSCSWRRLQREREKERENQQSRSQLKKKLLQNLRNLSESSAVFSLVLAIVSC